MTLDPVYALPKRQVSTFVSFVPVVMWQAQPDLPPEVDRWIWKSIGAKIPPSHLRINYASSGESEVEGSKRHPGQQAQGAKPAKPENKEEGGEESEADQAKWGGCESSYGYVQVTLCFSPVTSQSTSEVGEEETSSQGDEVPVSLPQITLVDSAPASADAAITKSGGPSGHHGYSEPGRTGSGIAASRLCSYGRNGGSTQCEL